MLLHGWNNIKINTITLQLVSLGTNWKKKENWSIHHSETFKFWKYLRKRLKYLLFVHIKNLKTSDTIKDENKNDYYIMSMKLLTTTLFNKIIHVKISIKKKNNLFSNSVIIRHTIVRIIIIIYKQ